MDAVIDIGSPVRYPRTGTVGKIVKIEERSGFSYAELDSTGLLYRTDLLVSALISDRPGRSEDHGEDMKQIEEERNLTLDGSLQEIPNLDGACSGAG
ncbi:MAG: DUF2098 domain-containing protein [Methanobacteriota archaeon]